jgi:hypothetical protein
MVEEEDFDYNHKQSGQTLSISTPQRANDAALTSVSSLTLPQWRLFAESANDDVPAHVQALARLIAAKNINVNDGCASLWLPPLLEGALVHRTTMPFTAHE